MAQIILDRVEKAYAGGVRAVDDLSLDIADGEFMVFVGPSGCGKSTALRSIAGLEEITGGTITIGDRVVNDLPPKDRDIAMVFQNYALYPHMTVDQNLAFGLELRKTPKAGDHPPGRRGGQDARPGTVPGAQARRAVRRPAAAGGDGPGIVREPQAFLMDEPLSNLDAKLRVSMRASLTQLHERLGRDHRVRDPRPGRGDDAGRPGLRAAGGRLQQVDTPQALFQAPVNLFVAGFIGSPAMNFVAAELVRDGRPAVTFAGTGCPCPARDPGGQARAGGLLRPGRSSWASARRTSRTPPSARRPRDHAGHRRRHRGAGQRDQRDLHHRRPARRARQHRRGREAGDDEDEATAALVGGKSLWTARVSEESRVRHGGRRRAGRGHPLPAVLRPGQRPVHRPPQGHGDPGAGPD